MCPSQWQGGDGKAGREGGVGRCRKKRRLGEVCYREKGHWGRGSLGIDWRLKFRAQQSQRSLRGGEKKLQTNAHICMTTGRRIRGDGFGTQSEPFDLPAGLLADEEIHKPVTAWSWQCVCVCADPSVLSREARIFRTPNQSLHRGFKQVHLLLHTHANWHHSLRCKVNRWEEH